jgi:hypothetical protein
MEYQKAAGEERLSVNESSSQQTQETQESESKPKSFLEKLFGRKEETNYQDYSATSASGAPAIHITDTTQDFKTGKEIDKDTGFEKYTECDMKLREKHEREYEEARNKLIQKYEERFLQEKEKIKAKHEVQLREELKKCKEQEYAKDKEQLKQGYEQELEKRLTEIRLLHDKEFENDLIAAKAIYDTDYEAERAELKKKHFEAFEKEKAALERKHENEYEKERNKLRSEVEKHLEKEKNELEKQHEHALSKEAYQSQAEKAKEFEKDLEQLKTKHEQQYASVPKGLKEDKVRMIIQDTGEAKRLAGSLEIQDTEKLTAKGVSTKLPEKEVKLHEHDVFDIHHKDWHTGSNEANIKFETKEKHMNESNVEATKTKEASATVSSGVPRQEISGNEYKPFEKESMSSSTTAPTTVPATTAPTASTAVPTTTASTSYQRKEL